jgi:hypothetical protein
MDFSVATRIKFQLAAQDFKPLSLKWDIFFAIATLPKSLFPGLTDQGTEALYVKLGVGTLVHRTLQPTPGLAFHPDKRWVGVAAENVVAQLQY